jgi:hypothetical protein
MTDNKNKDASKTANVNKIIYIGSDTGYMQLLATKFQEAYKMLNFEFEQLQRTAGREIQSLALYIRTEKPKLIFVDYSTKTSEMLHLVRILARLNGIIKPYIIGLVDYNQGIDPIQKGVLAGSKCVHIKSAELDAVVYDSICFAYPESLEEHGFATAKLNDEVAAFAPCKVGIISRDGIRIESNFPTTVGTTYSLHNYWYNKGLIKSLEVQCASSSSEDLYYNYNYAQEFGFEFAPNFEIQDDLEPEQIQQLEQEKEYLINDCKEKMENWIETNSDKSKPKMLKTLMIDKELNFYNDQPLSDEFPFVIRCQPYLKDVKEELLKIHPQLIVFNMEDVTSEELEANEDIAYTFNETRTLQFLVKIIKSVQGYNPFLIVFNSIGHDTEKLQMALNYKQIIAHKESMTPELVLKMAKLLESRLNANIQDYDIPTVFLQKDHPASYSEIELSINIIACSENDIYFNSDHDLVPGTVLRINLPAPMFLTVTEIPKNSNVQCQLYAIIHGIGEVEKKELRRFINSVFFREHEEKKQVEKEEFEKVNQQAVAKKEQAIADAKAKEAAEAAEKAAKDKSEAEEREREKAREDAAKDE